MMCDHLLAKSNSHEGIEDRETFLKPRQFIVNTFDHITKEQFIEDA